MSEKDADIEAELEPWRLANVALLLERLRGQHMPSVEGTGGTGDTPSTWHDGPCVTDMQPWPCYAEQAARLLPSHETTPAGVLDKAALDVDRQRAFVNWVRLWWSGANGFAVVPAGNDEVVAEDFEDMERELAALGIRLATFRAAALGRSGSGGRG